MLNDQFSSPKWVSNFSVASVGVRRRSSVLVAAGVILCASTTTVAGAQDHGGRGPLFRAAVTYPAGGYGPPHAMAVGDVSGDGMPDIILAICETNLECGAISVLLSNGDGTFRALPPQSSGGNGASAIAIADVNADSTPDLLVANFASDTIGVLLGNGDGSFQAAVAHTTISTAAGPRGPTSVAVADLNGDRVPDLAVTNAGSISDQGETVSILFGRGDATFADPVAFRSGGVSARSVNVADVNADGRPDLIVTNDWASFSDTASGTVGILIGDGRGGFASPVAYKAGGWGIASAAIADVNADTVVDVVVTTGRPKGVSVLLGNGDGTLRPATVLRLGGNDPNFETRAGSVSIADLNGDGRPDVLAGSCFGDRCDGAFFVLLGVGDGTFEQPATYDVGGFGIGLVASADLDRDKRIDVEVATCADWPCSTGSIAVLLGDDPTGIGDVTEQTTGSSDAGATASALPAILAVMPGAAAYNVRIVSDSSPDLTDLDSFIYSTTSQWPSSAEKVWALFYWSHILKRQTSPIVMHGFDVTDPIRNFTDFGFAMCSTISGINQSLYEAIGLRHEYWDVCNHTVSNVEFDGKFHMVDSSMSNLVTLDDGVTLADVVEASADSARLVRLHSLYATSPSGFLTGSDTIRNLADVTSPLDGSTVSGFADAFCAGGLKKRDYYYNWNRGHRYVLNLREDESYTRYYHQLGSTADYWIGSEQVASPDPNVTFQNDASNRFGLHGNGSWSFAAPLLPATYQRAIYAATNIAAAASGGLAPALPGAASVIYKIQAADVIASQTIQARFSRSDAGATATIAISLNHGRTWYDVATIGATLGTVNVNVALRNEVNGAYETLVRIQLATTANAPSGLSLTGLTITTITHVNAKALPSLRVGRNEVYVGAGSQSDTMVLWPDLRGTLWQKDAYDSRNIASQDVSVPRKYTAVVYPSALTTDAYLTYRLDAPTDVTGITYGGRLYNSSAGSYIDLLHSFDGGATWTRSYRLDTVSLPYDVIHYETVASVPAGTRTVLFKYLIHNTSTAATRASGLYAIRMEVDHRPSGSVSAPIDVTWTWKEVQPNRTTITRSHKQRVSTFPSKYVIDVGGSDHPIMESVKVNVTSATDASPVGYSDGVDVGGQRYLYRKRIDGANLALNKPYTISAVPSGFQGSPLAANTTILTDGIVGAPQSGGISFWWGQCWTASQRPVIQIDLGQSRTVGAVRAHLFGYPWLDAMKGQVQDSIEVQTSIDGSTFTSQGFLPTALWKKDVPINYMLLDDETATGWNFERRLAAPVTARYVRYLITPVRSQLCISELQVLDRVDDQTFDIRIALPNTPPPVNQSPTVSITTPLAGATVTLPASVTIAANAADADGSIARVDFLVNGSVIASDTAAPWATTWTPSSAGTYTLTARAYDNVGALATSSPVSITAQAGTSVPGEDVVVWAAEAQVIAGWTVTPDTTAAGGARLQNPDAAAAKIVSAAAVPAKYFELTFNATAGRGYRLWIRGKAQSNSYANDSVYVQFDHSLDENRAVAYRIGTSSAITYVLEDCSGCGEAGWGWQDNGYGAGVLGPLVYFDVTGLQRVRVQVREDGLGIDQIVLSSTKWVTTRPGAATNDAVILAKTDSQIVYDDVVLWASAAAVTAGWTVTADATAAGGARLQNPDAAAAKITSPVPAPAQYFELTFNAIAGRGYRLWIRGKAQSNSYANDSVFVQFDHSLDQNRAVAYRIGTTSALTYVLEDCSGCGVAGWGWQDTGYGLGTLGPLVYFDTTGLQRIRIQVREDGLGIDQIVLSSAKWVSVPPGDTKNDQTILPRTGS